MMWIAMFQPHNAALHQAMGSTVDPTAVDPTMCYTCNQSTPSPDEDHQNTVKMLQSTSLLTKLVRQIISIFYYNDSVFRTHSTKSLNTFYKMYISVDRKVKQNRSILFFTMMFICECNVKCI